MTLSDITSIIAVKQSLIRQLTRQADELKEKMSSLRRLNEDLSALHSNLVRSSQSANEKISSLSRFGINPSFIRDLSRVTSESGFEAASSNISSLTEQVSDEYSLAAKQSDNLSENVRATRRELEYLDAQKKMEEERLALGGL